MGYAIHAVGMEEFEGGLKTGKLVTSLGSEIVFRGSALYLKSMLPLNPRRVGGGWGVGEVPL